MRAPLPSVAEGRADQVLSISYGRDEALPNLQGSYGFGPGAVRSRDGRTWMPTLTGLAMVRPERVSAHRTPPPVIIERVMLDGQKLALPPGAESQWGQAVQNRPGVTPRLPPGRRKLEFEFTALSFIAPENTRFRHRLAAPSNSGAQRAAEPLPRSPLPCAWRVNERLAAPGGVSIFSHRQNCRL